MIEYSVLLMVHAPPDHYRSTAWVPSHLIDLPSGNAKNDREYKEKLEDFLAKGGLISDLEGNREANLLASRCAAEAESPDQPLHEAIIKATKNMQIIAALIWADFKGYGKGTQSEEDRQAEAMRVFGDADDELPNDDEDLLAAWDLVQGAPEEPD